MLGIIVTIVRYISDEPQPGIVECQLEDAHGRRWSVSTEHLDADTTYPQRGVVAGEIVQRNLDAAGREVVRFDTAKPWNVESVDGVTEFDVLPESLVEL
jgi:hypothetical protein